MPGRLTSGERPESMGSFTKMPSSFCYLKKAGLAGPLKIDLVGFAFLGSRSDGLINSVFYDFLRNVLAGFAF